MITNRYHHSRAGEIFAATTTKTAKQHYQYTGRKKHSAIPYLYWRGLLPRMQQQEQQGQSWERILINRCMKGVKMGTLFSTDGDFIAEFSGSLQAYLEDLSMAAPGENNYIDLVKANLAQQELTGLVLMDADLRMANLSEAVLYWAILFRSDFSKADLRSADLRGADLKEARFVEADLRGADLGVGNMGKQGASLEAADFTGANMEGVRLVGARYSMQTKWPASITHIDLKECILVEYE